MALLIGLVMGCGTDWEDDWVDSQGRIAPEGVVTSYPGPEHCDWESSVFLIVRWPLGSEGSPGRRMYVRDPEGLFTDYLSSEFLDDAELPAEARFSGYRRDEAELWLDPSEIDNHVFIVRGDDVERWPRSTEFIACA